MKKFKALLALLLLLLIAALAAADFITRDLTTPLSKEQVTIDVSIPKGASAGYIAQELQDRGVIRRAWTFRLLVRYTKTDTLIKSGTYSLSPSLSPYVILGKLVKGENEVARVTIPEGFTMKQIAAALSSSDVVGEKAFLEAASRAVITLPGPDGKIKGLEGFLFPDTYDYPPHVTPQQAIQPMLDRFRQLVLPLYKKSHPAMSLRDIVTLASLVEREAKLPNERAIIAGVYYNRLKKKMPLQCDATIQYLLPRQTVDLTAADLKIKSPYNTYLHAGLPPGPIANPGIASIQAALHPARVPYLYYVARGDGGHTFSVTYAQHLHAVKLYDQWLSKHGGQ